MLTQNLLPPHVPAKNMRRFMDDLLDELNLSAPIMQKLREADADVFAAEFGHSAFACLDVECRRENCVALQERILAAHGYTLCSVCHCTVNNLARLDCGSCAD